jgi:hypothetical protein
LPRDCTTAVECGQTVGSLDSYLRKLRYHYIQLSDKSVATPGNGFNVARSLNRVVKHFSKLSDGSIQTTFRIHEGSCRPKLFLQFVTNNDFSLPLNQEQQYLKGLVLHSHPDAIPPQFTGARI